MLLIDGTAFIHRAYHGLHYKNNPSPLSAVLGTVRMLRKVLDAYQPAYAAIALDRPGAHTFRHECLPGYKRKRSSSPEDFVMQVPYCELAVEALGLKLFNPIGWEADDVLASLAFWATNIGHRVTIVSSDKDLLQLVRPGIQVYDDRNKATYTDGKSVFDKLGVFPSQIPAYLGLVGDSSDCIPGVKGIGAKTAAKLLMDCGTFEGIYKKAERDPKTTTNRRLLQYKKDALLSKYLATLRVDVDLGSFTIDDLCPKPVRADVLENMLPNSGWEK